MWQCSTCTYENISHRTVCEMCQSKAPTTTQTPTKNEVSSSSKTWFCAACTFENSSNTPQCSMCDAKQISSSNILHTNNDSNVNESVIQNLQSLGGFTRQRVVQALSLNNNESARAAEWLLSQPDEDVSVSESSHTMMMDPDVASATLAKAKQKEHERLQQQHELDAAKSQRIRDEMMMNKELKEKKQRALHKQRNTNRLASARKRAETQRRTQNIERERIKNRLNIEHTLIDMSMAIRSLKTRYGMDGLKNTLALIVKLITNIIHHPTDPKFRTLSMHSSFFQDKIAARIGASAILRELGFRVKQQQNNDDKQETNNSDINNDDLDHDEVTQTLMVMESPDYEKLKIEVDKMKKVINLPLTTFPTVLASVSAKCNLSSEHFMFILMSLHTIIDNVLIAPHSSLAKRIDIRSDMFQTVFAPLNKSCATILNYIDFMFEKPHFFTCQADYSSLKKIPKIRDDLNRLINVEEKKTCVALAFKRIETKNSWKTFSSLIEVCLSVLKKLVTDMHETRNHTVSLENVLKHTNKIDGLREAVESLGFKANTSMTVFTVPYPYRHGVVEYELRLKLLETIWTSAFNTHKKAMK